MLAGHVMLHSGFTVTVKLHDVVFIEVSVAVHVTVVVPTGKLDPDGGTHATVCPGQLSVAVGSV
jgi:hypothetical protein